MGKINGDFVRGDHTTYIDDAEKFINKIKKAEGFEGISIGINEVKKGKNSKSRTVKIVVLSNEAIKMIIASKSTVQTIIIYNKSNYQKRIIKIVKEIAKKNNFHFNK